MVVDDDDDGDVHESVREPEIGRRWDMGFGGEMDTHGLEALSAAALSAGNHLRMTNALGSSSCVQDVARSHGEDHHIRAGEAALNGPGQVLDPTTIAHSSLNQNKDHQQLEGVSTLSSSVGEQHTNADDDAERKMASLLRNLSESPRQGMEPAELMRDKDLG